MIFDCFPFFNELNILDIRLNLLNEHVDYFILVESSVTHTYKKKPLYYYENKEKFKKFEDKIIHLVIGKPIDSEMINDTWKIENNQRLPIYQYLTSLNHDIHHNDIILISDVDEIPNLEFFTKNYNYIDFPHVFMHDFYYGNFLRRIFNKNNNDYEEWYGTIGLPYNMIIQNNFNLNYLIRKDRFDFIHTFKKIYGGVHFSYFFPNDNLDDIYAHLTKKIESFAHYRYNDNNIKNNLLNNLLENEDILSRKHFNLKIEYPKPINNFYKNLIEFIINNHPYLLKEKLC
jgi:beta-1,4-mannosyl-glycoprotein beta-1,4-N-acetylglucosaminyltransferase